MFSADPFGAGSGVNAQMNVARPSARITMTNVFPAMDLIGEPLRSL
jgi:hypothetical protein